MKYIEDCYRNWVLTWVVEKYFRANWKHKWIGGGGGMVPTIFQNNEDKVYVIPKANTKINVTTSIKIDKLLHI